jgi:hypothetical protein
VDAAIVISNDSDLKFPIERVPISTVHPGHGQLAGDLRDHPTEGAGRHSWRQLTAADFTAHQLPNPPGGYTRPTGW